MHPTADIRGFLTEIGVPYAILPHPAGFSAQEEAARTHVPGRDWAKVVASRRSIVPGHGEPLNIPHVVGIRKRCADCGGGPLGAKPA